MVLPDGFINSPFSKSWSVPEYDESSATESLNVAAVSFDVDLSPDINRNKMIVFIEKIKV